MKSLRLLIAAAALVPASSLPLSIDAPAPIAAPRPLAVAAIELVREPFLQKISDTSATVVWATEDDSFAEVRYAGPGVSTVVVPATTTLYSAAYTGMAADYYQHEATLTGLESATTYTYELLAGGVSATAAPDQLTTAPPKGSGTVKFIVFGDSGSGGPEQYQLASLMGAESAADRFDLALHTGDVVYPKGTHQLLQDRFFKVYESWLRRRPIFPAFGNHEEYADGGQPYLDVFALPENGASPVFPDHRERYYSFDYGPIHFIALDTQIGFSSNQRLNEQLKWLVQDLDATTQPWRIVYFHRPAYGSSDASISLDVRTNLRPILERYGVQLVLAGHEHSYARGVPWREGALPSSAVSHVVTGGGGAGLTRSGFAPWLATSAEVFHYLRASVTDCNPSCTCELTLEAVGIDGVVFDSFTLPLRDQQRDAEVPQVAWAQPSADTTVTGITTLSATASDDTQLAKVDVWIDGVLRMVADRPPYAWSWNTTSDLNGTHALQLVATDIAGRQGLSAIRVLNVRNTDPTVQLLSPLDQDRAFTGLPYRIRWAAAAGDNPLHHFDVELSSDGGRTFQMATGCASLPSDARECMWSAPGPVTKKAVARLTVSDTAARHVSSTSRVFEVKSGTTSLELKNPDKPVSFGIGSRQSVFWSTGLAVGATMSVDISRDGGIQWASVKPSLVNATKELRWTVTPPATTRGLVRVRSLNSPLEDVSSALFAIEPPRLAVTVPGGASVWTAGTQVKVKWSTNLGLYDRVVVRLSTDGGVSFPVVLAGCVPASQRMVTITAPSLATDSARVRVEVLDNPAWTAVSPASFSIR
jgi:hypothetical protein